MRGYDEDPCCSVFGYQLLALVSLIHVEGPYDDQTPLSVNFV